MSEYQGPFDNLLIYDYSNRTFRPIRGRLLPDGWNIRLPGGESICLSLQHLPLKAEILTDEHKGLLYDVHLLSGGYNRRPSTDFLKSTILIKDP